mgnify:CR=1 FL=1
MNPIRKLLIVSLMLCCSIPANTQTVFATETFGTGAAQGTLANGFVGDMGAWGVTNTGANGADANNWYVSGEECGNAVNTCGSACPGGDNSLHVSAIGGLCGVPDCGAAYNETGAANQTNQRAESPTIDCTNLYGLELNFNYIAAQGDDGFWVEYSTDNGATWTTFTGGIVPASQCCSCLDAFLCGFGICCPPQTQQSCASGGQGNWTAANLSFPAAAENNNQVKFAFHWSNDGNGVGTDPSVAIDDITLTYAVILPIELIDFKAENNNGHNEISWTTLSESNSSHFVINHSTDGVNYRPIGEVSAAKESSEERNYNFLHEVSSTQNYYKLKLVDINGQYEYSDPIFIEDFFGNIQISHDAGRFILSGLEDKKGIIQVCDLTGKKVVPTINIYGDQKTQDIDLYQLNSGIYVITLITNEGEKQFKVMR